jgi:hypothetical protein
LDRFFSNPMGINPKAFPLAAIAAGGILLTGLNAGSAKADLSCTFGDFSGCNGTEGGIVFRAPRKISAFQCFCGHEKAANRAA